MTVKLGGGCSACLSLPAWVFFIGLLFLPHLSRADAVAGSNTVSWLINIDFGTGTASEKTGLAAVGQTPNDFWNLYTREGATPSIWRTFGVVTNLKQADGTPSGANLSVANAPGAWGNHVADAMYDGYLYPFDGGNIGITVDALPAGQYDFFFYGHGPVADQNSTYELLVGGANYGTRTTVFGSGWETADWQEGMQYVVFRGVSVASAGDVVNVIVHPAASPYAFIAGMQIAAASAAVPPPPPPPANTTALSLINVDFGTGTASEKTGFAAVGQTASDFWNLYTREGATPSIWRTFGVVTNLVQADGTFSGVNLSVANAPGAWGNGVPDAMYDGYLYPFNGGNITITVDRLPVGQYDIYCYGHGPVPEQNSAYEVIVGQVNYGTQATVFGAGWETAVWQEGMQYVVFRGVRVTNANDGVTILARPGASPYAFIAGLQIVAGQLSAPVPSITPVRREMAASVLFRNSSITLNMAPARDGSLRFTLPESTSMRCEIEYSSNLVNWITLTNLVNPRNPVQVNDPEAATVPYRFYRARLEQ